MTLETRVFLRIISEHREAGIRAVDKTMAETVRFGTFNDGYRRGCAEDRYADELRQIQSFPLILPV